MYSISGKTGIFGILGYPLKHTLSPVMHNAAFASLGLDYCYVPLEVKPQDLRDAVKGIKALGIKGINITIPYKEAVIPFLDELSPEAGLIGAVNAVQNLDGKLIGYNTDGRGFIQGLIHDAHYDPRGKRVLVLGGGGAARSVAIQLALSGVTEIWLANRTRKRTEEIAYIINREIKTCQAQVCPLDSNVLSRLMPRVDMLIHTTPVGMYPCEGEAPLVEPELLNPDLMVVDLIYNPPMTRLLKEAARRECRTLNGLSMLVYQGAIAFEIWTGQRAPLEIMRQAISKHLKQNT